MSDLRESLNTAFAEAETTSASEVDTSAPAAPVEARETPSDAPAAAPQSDTPEKVDAEPVDPDKPKPITEVAGDVTDVKDKTAPTPSSDPRIDRAPNSWKGDAKGLWQSLPLRARQEVIRRERDTSNAIREASESRQRVEQITAVFEPHMQRIQSMHGGNALQAVSGLLNVERTLAGGTSMEKAQLVAHMIKHFGVDIPSLDSMLSGGEVPQEKQQFSQLEQILNQRLAPVMTFLERQQMAERQRSEQVQQQAVQTIESMVDNPQYPYFDVVREEMADLIEFNARKGIDLSLQDAYAKAVRMNDNTFQSSSVRESTHSATGAALAAHQQAQRAKGAAVSVSGAPSGVGGSVGNPNDLRGTILEAFGATGGRT
jgi:hypothetical protein